MRSGLAGACVRPVIGPAPHTALVAIHVNSSTQSILHGLVVPPPTDSLPPGLAPPGVANAIEPSASGRHSDTPGFRRAQFHRSR